MCGIFGMVRSTTALNPERASAAFVELGRLSVERGRDSAGFALANPDWTGYAADASKADAEQVAIRHNGVTIIKNTVSFDALWDDEDHLPLLAEHRIAVGHTRFATQGNRTSNLNVSPLALGALVGTHNGDVDTYTVRNKFGLPKANGGTDTEVLYRALNRDRRDRRNIVKTLTEVEGRAALAWLDREKADRVYLARAALSPLSTAYDAQGNFYWASNPRWFRDIDAMFDHAIGFHSITMVAEGSLLTIDAAAAEPVVTDVRRFEPICRASDSRLSDGVVWRGFEKGDITVDKAQVNHRVAKALWTPQTSKTARTSAKHTVKRTVTTTVTDPTARVAGRVVDDPWFMDAFDPENQATAADSYDEHFGEEWARDENGFTPAEAEEWDRAVAKEAYERWIEQGEDDAVLGVIRSSTMPSEREQVMEEFDLPSPASLNLFRDLLDVHVSGQQSAPAF
jgi:glucosamine--fructose-6-phosphate aminotransferase (isomerizing)